MNWAIPGVCYDVSAICRRTRELDRTVTAWFDRRCHIRGSGLRASLALLLGVIAMVVGPIWTASADGLPSASSSAAGTGVPSPPASVAQAAVPVAQTVARGSGGSGGGEGGRSGGSGGSGGGGSGGLVQGGDAGGVVGGGAGGSGDLVEGRGASHPDCR